MRNFLLLIGLMPLATYSLDEPWNIQALMHALADSKHPPVHYSETRESAYLDIPLTSRGILRLPNEDTLVKEKHHPQFERVTVERTQITIERANTAARTISTSDLPGIYNLSEGLGALFHGQLQHLRKSFDTNMSGERRDWHLTLTPRDGQLATSLEKIVVHGAMARIQDIFILESDGDGSLLQLGAPVQ